jgi:uncharacterized membrane protein YhiD involved in acid resistance
MLNLFDLTGQGLLQLEELLLAFVLSALVGLEREARQKAAGLRTYTLVGVSAALFMLVSKYGFNDVLANGRVVLDPSRVAAQDLADAEGTELAETGKGVVSLSMQVKGKRPVSQLIARLSDIDGVVEVGSLAEEMEFE